MGHMQDIASSLVQDDPRAQAARIVETLCRITGARGIAVLVEREGALSVFVGFGVELRRIATLERKWGAHTPVLAAGQIINLDGATLAPLLLGELLVGALFVEGGVYGDDMEAALVILAYAIVAGQEKPTLFPSRDDDGLMSSRQMRAVNARQLTIFCARHEWNLSSAARAMGVTRRTLYLKLKALNVKRQRVPKSYKRIPQ